MQDDDRELSRGWRYGVLSVMAAGFAVLIWIAVRTYQIGPPIPEKVLDAGGNTLFTGADITAGQQVFLKHGLMDNGTLWGHGAYLGPDFSAAYLHQLALDAGDILAQRNFRRAAADLEPPERATLTGQVHELLSENRYDARTRTLTFTDAEAASFRKQIGQWRDYFAGSRASRGLPAGTISRPGGTPPAHRVLLLGRVGRDGAGSGQDLFLHEQFPVRTGRSATGRRPTPSSGAR